MSFGSKMLPAGFVLARIDRTMVFVNAFAAHHLRGSVTAFDTFDLAMFMVEVCAAGSSGAFLPFLRGSADGDRWAKADGWTWPLRLLAFERFVMCPES